MSDMSPGRCKLPHCHVPETPCDCGELEYWKHCPHYIRGDDVDGTLSDSDHGTEFPWTGNTLGLDELTWLAARQRPRVLAPVGPQNAGKTTFLVAMYLGLCRGMRLQGHRFAGSYTIGGWENLANYLRYPPQGVGPGFPPHTPAAAKVVPGLLHLAVRRDDGRLVETVIADASGEWFTDWSVNVDHPSAEGARWVARHSDGFLLFVDCDALAGPERGVARDALFTLAQRLAACVETRPVAVVWAKSDINLRPAMHEQVDKRLRQLFPTARHFRTTVKPADEHEDVTTQFLTVVASLLSPATCPGDIPAIAVRRPDDPFLAFRGLKR